MIIGNDGHRFKQEAPIGQRRPRTWTALAVLAALLAVADAVRLAWICDDAFISLRYARNLVRGLGLVYNAGEHVEGYTNFLWTVLAAGGIALGLSPVRFVLGLGIVAYAATLGLLARAGRRMADALDRPPLYLALFGWAALAHAREFATSGLETALVCLLDTWVILLAAEADTVRQWIVVGIVGAVAVLTRPDAGIFGLVALLGAGRRPRHLLAALLPLAVILGPYAAWKLDYYGDLRPNTYYAKSAGVAWWSQGFYYLGLYFQTYWPVAFGWLVALALVLRRRIGRGDLLCAGAAGPRADLLIFASTTLWLIYVARVGGDFMFARFALPATPLLLLALERAALALPEARWRRPVALLLAAALALGVLPRDLAEGRRMRGIADERRFYPWSAIEAARREGAYLREVLAGTRPRVAIYGGQAMLAYYADFPLVIEAATGLTDATIARQPLMHRAWVGHDKDAPQGYLEARGVEYRFAFRTGLEPHEAWTDIDFGQGVKGYLVTWNQEAMDVLARRGVRFTDARAVVDSVIRRMDRMTDDQVRSAFRRLKGYYFDHNRDPERRAPFLARLGR